MAAAMCALLELMRLSDVYLRCSSGVAVSWPVWRMRQTELMTLAVASCDDRVRVIVAHQDERFSTSKHSHLDTRICANHPTPQTLLFTFHADLYFLFDSLSHVQQMVIVVRPCCLLSCDYEGR